jgi:hypothetical protein
MQNSEPPPAAKPAAVFFIPNRSGHQANLRREIRQYSLRGLKERVYGKKTDFNIRHDIA